MISELRLIDVDGNDVHASFEEDHSSSGHGDVYTISFCVDRPVRAARVVAHVELRVNEMIEHGFQSWSTVRRCRPNDVRPDRALAPRWFRGQMLAERDSAGVELAGETFLVHDRGVAGFLGARYSFTRIVVAADGSVNAEWILDGIELSANEEFQLDSLWIGTGSPGALYSHYAALSGALMAARSPRPTPRVWCSWYQYFGDVTPADIRANAVLAREHDIQVIQIDDGWQREIGVWTDVNERWARPMSQLAGQIQAAGMTAGVWTAPFLAIDGGEIAREHPEWLVRNDAGEATTALHHGGWGGKVFALDTTRDDVIEHIAETYRTLRAQGFDYFKIDFCHAGAAVGRRSSSTMTRAVALRRGLQAVRDGIGDDAYLVGCGCPLLSAVGIVDAMRVSEDVAPYYEPRLFFPGFPEITVAARNAIEQSILRAPLHQRWFTLDPDCVLLRPTATELTQHEREMVAAMAFSSSGFIVLSDDLSLYGDEEWRLAQQLFEHSSSSPRDLLDPFADDVTIRWDDTVATFNWDDRRFELRF